MSFGLFGQSRDVLFEQAQSSYRKRDLEAARDQIDQVLSRFPDAKSHYLSGLIHEAAGNELRALADFEATLQYDDAYREALFQRGLINLRHGNAEKAIADFTRLLNGDQAPITRGIYFQIDPTGQQQNRVVSLSDFQSQLYHYRGQAFEAMGDYVLAMKDYDMAIQLTPSADYFISRGLLKNELGHTSGAKHDLESVLQIDAGNQLAWYNLALIDPTLQVPDSLISSDDFVPTLHLLGSRALESEDYTVARQYFDRYLQNYQTDALAFINRGRVLIKLSEYTRARNDFITAHELDHSHAEALYLIGNTYFFEEEYENAIAYYDQYLALDPDNAMIWYNGAMAHFELDNEVEACHFLSNAAKYGMSEATAMLKEHCR